MEISKENQNERFFHTEKLEEDKRKAWEVDYARVIHSASFRRLQDKTQIFKIGDNDFYRTRLTHSLEVAQIAAGITHQLKRALPKKDGSQQKFLRKLLPKNYQIQAIGLTHDLGHPPFGHGGEVALNYCMRNDGGFEGNAQTLRVLSKLEKYTKENGANLTRRVLLGVLKYPIPYGKAKKPNPASSSCTYTQSRVDAIANLKEWAPPKCYFDEDSGIVEWILRPFSSSDRENFFKYESVNNKHRKSKYKSFDCSIMDLADDISFGVHDLEDVSYLKLLDRTKFSNWVSEDVCGVFLETMLQKGPDEFQNIGYERMIDMLFGDSAKERKFIIGRLVAYFIRDALIKDVVPPVFEDPLLKYRVTMGQTAQVLLDALKKVVMEEVIQSPDIKPFEFKGQQMVVKVFEALDSDPQHLLPRSTYEKFKNSGKSKRIICDHIAGMTDGFLCKTYERLYSPRQGAIFDKL